MLVLFFNNKDTISLFHYNSSGEQRNVFCHLVNFNSTDIFGDANV